MLPEYKNGCSYEASKMTNYFDLTTFILIFERHQAFSDRHQAFSDCERWFATVNLGRWDRFLSVLN